MQVYTDSGMMLSLKEPPLASGGEGSVYEIEGYQGKLVKLYHRTEDAVKRRAKITVMAGICQNPAFRQSGILKKVSWPQAALYDRNHNFIGFGMNMIEGGKLLDDIYCYPPAKDLKISTKEKVKCLISLCNAIERLHNMGHQFGDFNPENIKVFDDCTVGFVDADSYHIHDNGRLYKCFSGTEGYVAPELLKKVHGITYEACAGETFTDETDNFALAVHCFRMLFNGCHPYTCAAVRKGQGSLPAPKPIDQLVENGDTPFFKLVNGFKPPNWVPEVSAFPPYLTDLFKRAFVDGHSDPKKRPTPSEWRTGLTSYLGELVYCPNDGRHYYWKLNSSCPYCAADNRASDGSAGRNTASGVQAGAQSGTSNNQATTRSGSGNNQAGTQAGAQPANKAANTTGSQGIAPRVRTPIVSYIQGPEQISILHYAIWVLTAALFAGIEIAGRYFNLI